MRHRLNIGIIAAFLLMPLSLLAANAPIQIGTLAELKAFAKRVNNGETTLDAVLTADITVSYNVLKYDGTDLRDHRYPPTVMWTSIGLTQDKAYRGTFDGQGHAINGLYGVTSKEYEHPVALFGFLNGATIKNLSIHDSYLMGGEGIWTGAIAHSSHESHITDIASAACVKGMDRACGLVGESDGDTFEHCLVVGNVESTVSGGTYGIAHTDNSTMTECYTTTDDAEAIRGGALTYYFNNGVTDGTQHWYQRIGIDNYPRDRFIEGGTVYQRYQDCRPIYTNNPEAYYADPHHPYDSDGYCSICGTYSNPVPEQATDGYWKLSNVGQLDWLNKYVNAGNTTVKACLVSDIQISSDKRLEPMNLFEGTLDGNGFTIKGLRIEGGGASLILTANNAVIKNLNIEYSYFYGSTSAAPLVSTLNNSQIINCRTLNNHLEGTIQSGLVCNVSSGSRITNCYSDAKLYVAAEEDNLVNSYANVTDEQLHNGELAYQLDQNRPDGSDHWYQRIGTDSIPVMSSKPVEGGIVYRGYVSCETFGYNNDEEQCSQTPLHIFNERGVCVQCRVYQQPPLSEDGFYEINCLGQLYWFGEYVNASVSNRAAKARLLRDIEFCGDMPEWTPITEFNGTLDGQGYAIRGLRPNVVDGKCSFILTSISASIKNLCIINGVFNSSSAPFVFDFDGSMTNCCSLGNVSSSGFVVNFNTGTMENCFTDKSALASIQNGTVTNCYVSINTSDDSCSKGKLAFDLNNGMSDGTQTWHQRIGTDNYPMARKIEDGTVYSIIVQCRNRVIGYTNDVNKRNPQHDMNSHNICRFCAGDEIPFKDDNYHYINELGNLMWFVNYVNQDESHRYAKAKIRTDIDLDGIVWEPINEFYGEIDGMGHAIKNANFDANSPIVLHATNGAVIWKLCLRDCKTSQDATPLFVASLDNASLKYCSAINCDNSSVLVSSKTSGGSIRACFTTSARILASGNGPENNYANVSAADMASGKLTYQLNKSNNTGVWCQRLGTDEAPIARSIHDGVVYASYSGCYSSTEPYKYTNNYEEVLQDHNYVNGICDYCHGVQAPQIVDNCYQISNAGNLFWFGEHVGSDYAYHSVNARLTCDIDVANINKDWPYVQIYQGNFDGQGFAIKHLTISKEGEKDGFVKYLNNGGTLQNIAFVECTCKNDAHLMAYYVNSNAYIKNCSSINTISTTDQKYLIEYCNGTLDNCFTNKDFILCKYPDGTSHNNHAASDEEMANGALAYNLNQHKTSGSPTWCQRLGVDAYPVPRNIEGGWIYQIFYRCNPEKIGYSNAATILSHNYNEDGICEYCNGYLKPEWNADYAGGSGAYVIAKPGNLLWVQKNSTTLNKNLVFVQDIDMSKYNWESIDVMEAGVTIEGQGHVIRGLKSDQAGKTALVILCSGNIINLGIEQSSFADGSSGNDKVTFATKLTGQLLFCWSFSNNGAEAMVASNSGSITSCFSDKNISKTNKGTVSADCKENVTQKDISCGKLTYLLNQGTTDGTQHWYQRLGTDNMPRPIVLEGGTVYETHQEGHPDVEGYSNTEGSEAYHAYNQYDICTSCGHGKLPPYSGNYYHLSTANHLMWLSNRLNIEDPGKRINVYLDNDIDMSGVPFSPISRFEGNFDGQGYTIRGLNMEDAYQTALILEARNYTSITNLCIENSNFKAPKSASFVITLNNSRIDFCKAINNKHTGTSGAGMVYGMNADSYITSSYSDAYVIQNDNTNGNMYSCFAHVATEVRKSGELTRKLNDNKNIFAWYQRLGIDDDPIARRVEGGIVYYTWLSCAEDTQKGYTNYQKRIGDHTYVDHFCTFCHIGEPAPLGEDDYYELSNEGHLMWFAYHMNMDFLDIRSIKARLMDDITLNPRPSNLDPQLIWIPIGKDAEHPFEGEIDGQGHTISGLWTDDDSRDYVGLCGYTNEALIRNLVISDAHLRGKSYVGAIAGYAYDSSILNCRVIDDSSIEAVVADGDQKSGIHAGGLIGYAAGDTQLSSSYSMAAVSGRENSSVGGLIGMFNNDNHVSCINSYYLAGKAPVCWRYSDGKTVPTDLTFTMEQAASGNLTYRLNDEKSDNVQWYQVLKRDAFPTTEIDQCGIIYPEQETCVATGRAYSNTKPSGLVEHQYVRDTEPKIAGTHYYGRHCSLCGKVDETSYVLFNWDGRGSSIDVTHRTTGSKTSKTTLITIPSLTIDADDIPEFNFDKLGDKIKYCVAESLKFKRAFLTGELYTVVFPFDITAAVHKELGDFYKMDYIDRTHGTPVVNFTKVTGTLSATTAYIFKPKEDLDEITIPKQSSYGWEIHGEYNLALKAEGNRSNDGLYGTFHQMNLPYGSFGFVAGTGQLARLGNTAWTRPFRAFIWLNNIDQSRISFSLTDEDTEETGILAIDEEGNLTTFDGPDSPALPIYDLTGRRITRPIPGHVYIRNGRKFIAK